MKVVKPEDPISERATPPLNSADPSVIRVHLERVLASAHMKNSKRCQSLLKYVVEAAIEGKADRIKERTIGIEVFGRHSNYDTNEDSVVRNAAIEVRKRLAQYYLESGGAEPVRIVLPQGGYVPQFQPATPQPSLELRPEVKPGTRRNWVLAALILASCLLVGAWLLIAQAGRTDLDRLWAPLVNDNAGVVICIGQPAKLYVFTGPKRLEFDAKMVGDAVATDPQPADIRAQVPLTLRDLAPVGGRYLFLGDATCATKIAVLLQSKRKPFQIRGETATPFQDLRGSPAVLVGFFNNKWTLHLTGGLRYYFERNPGTGIHELRDRDNPHLPPRVVHAEALELDIPEDYAIVTRVVDPSTEKTVITAAGVTHFGTLAAGDFLSSEAYVKEAFRHSPPDWDRKNVQVVLQTKVVGGTAGPPKVIATHLW